MPQTENRRHFLRQTASLSLAAGASLLPRTVSAAAPPSSSGGHMKLSCAAYSYRDYLTGNREPKMTLDDFIDRCAAMNLDACELTGYYFPKQITPEYLTHLKHKAFLLGLDISGTAVGNNFCLPPGAERDKQIGDVKQWIEHAARFGAPVIRIFAGSVPKGHSESEARTWAVDCIRHCCEYAAQHGVFLALENHGGITATADQVLAIVEQIDSPWFGLNFDTGNFHTADPYADLAKIAPRAITSQVKTEITRAGHAKEPADLARIIDILRSVRYRGYVALEYEAEEYPLVAIPRYCEELRQLIR